MIAAALPGIDFGAIIAIGGGFASLVYLVRLLRAEGTAAQLAAKDAIIATWQQSSAANEERIATLEKQVGDLTAETRALRAQLEAVEKYAAPEAVRRFEKQQERMIAILEAIQAEVRS